MTPTIEQVLQKLRVRFVAPIARPFSTFWSWWIDELAATLPTNVREALASTNKRIRITLENSHFVLSESNDSAQAVIGKYPLDTSGASRFVLPDQVSEIIFCLPPDKVLIRSMTLPLAAEENLREVLSFELDRQTPFTVHQAYYDYCISGRIAAKDSITVDLVVSPKNVVDDLLSKITDLGFTPDVVTAKSNNVNETMPVNLLPGPMRRRRPFAAPSLNTALAIICALLLVVVLVLPPVLSNQKLKELQLQQESAEVAAKDGLELRLEVARLTSASEFLIQKKRSSVPVLQMLAEVTRVLPDNTWLTRFDVSGTEIQLQGQSSSAAALIQLLESSPLFRDARFRSPVVQVPQTDMERFHLSVELQSVEST